MAQKRCELRIAEPARPSRGEDIEFGEIILIASRIAREQGKIANCCVRADVKSGKGNFGSLRGGRIRESTCPPANQPPKGALRAGKALSIG